MAKARSFLLFLASSLILINLIGADASSLNYERINSLIDSGSYEEAIDYLDKISVENPSDTDILFYYGYVLDDMGRHVEALDYYDQVLWYAPNDIDALYNKAVALENIGDDEKAMSYYDRVLEIDPADVDARISKGTILYDLGEYGDAMTEFENALEIEKDNSEAKSYVNKINGMQHPEWDDYSWIITPISIIAGIGGAVLYRYRQQKTR